jgi:hypothetical protein
MADDLGVVGTGWGELKTALMLSGAPLEGDSSRSVRDSSSGEALGCSSH